VDGSLGKSSGLRNDKLVTGTLLGDRLVQG
jgi:hypothetical protein